MNFWDALFHIVAILTVRVDSQPASTELAKQIAKSNPYNGRLGRSYTLPDVTEYNHDPAFESETSIPDDFSRSLRGRESNYIRFGRGRNDNYMRFGRGKQDNFMRFGRSNAVEKEPEKENNEFDRLTRSVKGSKKSEKFERLTKNFIRLGRATPDNFLRYRRGKQDNFMRFGRGETDNSMRYRRWKQDGFLRLGRGKDNFMRFGRGKQDNFMRFGRGKQENFMRFGRGKERNYMRFGRDMVNFDLPARKNNLHSNDFLLGSDDKPANFDSRSISTFGNNIPTSMQSLPKGYDDFNRFLRSRQENFMRFGKSDANQQPLQALEFSEDLKNDPSLNKGSTTPIRDTFNREIKSKLHDDVNLLRQGRHPPNKDDNFIRFGRNSLDSLSPNLFPQRVKRSTVELDEDQEKALPSRVNEGMSFRILLPVFSLSHYLDEDPSSSELLEAYNSRRKRSMKFETSPSTSIADNIPSLNDVSSKLLVDSEKLSDTFIIPLFLPSTSSLFRSEE